MIEVFSVRHWGRPMRSCHRSADHESKMCM